MDRSSLLEYVKIRRHSGDTLRVIAEDFGVALMTVYRWCDGSRHPSGVHCRMADMLVREQLARGIGKDWPEFK